MLFSHIITEWYRDNKRDLPWRDTQDPYLIWMSEVILQQTRVIQGLNYYFLFVEEFPNIYELASADEEHILRLWQGLGYYSRARNMHKTAKLIVSEFNGCFPTNYKVLINLPGIGEYTAAAISSFSVNERRAVVDGNVFRVLARHFGITERIDTNKGKKEFLSLANELLDKENPGLHNQSIMEFGALQCKPQKPDCEICPLKNSCFAFAYNQVNEFPKKQKKAKSRNRFFNYFIIESKGKIVVKKRGAGDIWQHLYDFPMIETEKEMIDTFSSDLKNLKEIIGDVDRLQHIQRSYKHVLSHQNIYARFYKVVDCQIDLSKKPNWDYVLIKDLDKLAKPKLIVSFLEDYLNKQPCQESTK